MPNIKAAKKALRQSEKHALVNHSTKRRIHDSLQDFMNLVKSGKKDEAKKKVPSLFALLDKAAKNNIFHKNKAARKKSQLARAIK